MELIWLSHLERYLDRCPIDGYYASPVGDGFVPGCAPPLASSAAISSAVRNRPPGPRGRRMACLCLDS